jgi:hypothetical protein
MSNVRISNRIVRPLLAATSVLAFAASAGVAASGTTGPPQASLAIDNGHLTSRTRPSISGSINCTKGAHYRLNAWTAQQDRGALAKGSIPAKLGPRPTKIAIARARAATLCTGASQAWSLALTAVGKRPVGFAGGPAEACVVAYAGKSRLYTLAESCKQITLG